MKIRALHYRADKNDGHKLDDRIAWWGGVWNPGTEPYSHSEIWIPDYPIKGNGCEENQWTYPKFLGPGEDGTGEFGIQYMGKCFTSTMRGEQNGTVIRPASEVLKNPHRWDYTEIEVEDDFANMAIARARTAVRNNQGYDKPAIASFFWPWRFGSKSKDICSEVSKRFCMWCNIVDNCKIESPRRWSRTLTRLGHETRRLTP